MKIAAVVAAGVFIGIRSLVVLVLSEFFYGVKAAKYHALEEHIESKIHEARTDQVKSLRKYNYALIVLLCKLDTFSGFTQTLASYKRLEDFLLAEEVDKTEIPTFLEAPTDPNAPSIILEKASFAWESSKMDPIEQVEIEVQETSADIFKLEGFDLTIERVSLVAIVGVTGSGKSSLLSAITCGMRKTDGKVRLYHHLRLAPELTLRVALARAIVKNPDVYNLDDPLSAPDSHVDKEIIEGAINGPAMKGKTAVIATHLLHILPSVDQVIVMDGGKIVQNGSFKALMTDTNGRLFETMKDYHIDEETEEEEKAAVKKEESKGEDKKEYAVAEDRQVATGNMKISFIQGTLINFFLQGNPCLEHPRFIALSLTMTMQWAQSVNFTLMMFGELEATMVAVERLSHYAHELPHEAARSLPKDGKLIDIVTLGLKKLRSGIQMIPQNPTLFDGTVRSNVDPMAKYSDDDTWPKTVVVSCDCSIGKVQILIMNEATSSADAESDLRTQESMKTHFKDATVTSIAHRLNTIAAFDRILVPEHGKVAEFDSPHLLLLRENSIFGEIVNATGVANAAFGSDLE
ncbi:UNVERIFIED_CONTAM: hypothetical protein HDU68_008191 [Siphonaria sp. JEL0065]|nr:hypothetical protein HDU68_008191 [Siphonaria sp. JEL0065]